MSSLPARRLTGKTSLRTFGRLARKLGFGEVGFTRHDRHYTFSGKKRWAKFEHAICLAYEQDYRMTQTGPSPEADQARFETYEVEQAGCLKIAEYIRSRGYRAQVHDGYDCSGPLHTAVRRGGTGAAWRERAVAVAPFWLSRAPDARHHRCARDLRSSRWTTVSTSSARNARSASIAARDERWYQAIKSGGVESRRTSSYTTAAVRSW